MQGMITGLVCITPAARAVQGRAAIIMGMLLGSIPWFIMMVVHKRSELLQKVDDTMAMLHTHAIARALGSILTGLFAEPKLNRLFYGFQSQYVGLFYGFDMGKPQTGFRQLGLQFGGIVFITLLNIVSTTIICLGIQLIIPLRLSVEEIMVADEAVHEEEAYAVWGEGVGDGNRKKTAKACLWRNIIRVVQIEVSPYRHGSLVIICSNPRF